jgi:N-methylhydantoinase A
MPDYLCGWPELGEYERFVTTAINAYIGPKMNGYIHRIEQELQQSGFMGQIFISKSNGGVMTAARACEVPVETLHSGPAVGVIGAWHIARKAAIPKVIAFDMGGTSADISVLDGGITYSFNNEIIDLPLQLPSVDIYSIGAGGGSIARLDPACILKVGPESAGSSPGPSCYGLGGIEPTVTDAYVAAGIISPEGFLGGNMALDLDAAKGSLIKSLKGSPVEMACQVLDVATATMFSRFAPYLARLGVDPNRATAAPYLLVEALQPIGGAQSLSMGCR